MGFWRQELTRHDGRHKCGEHDKEDGEENEGCVVYHLESVVTHIEVEEANQYANCHMSQQTKLCQCLARRGCIESNTDAESIISIPPNILISTGWHYWQLIYL